MARKSVTQQPKKKRRKALPASPKKKIGRGKKATKHTHLKRYFLFALESIGLIILATVTIMVMIGYFANLFSGTDLLNNLLPFAGSILFIIVLATFLVALWKKFRGWLVIRSNLLPPTIVFCLTLLVCSLVQHDLFTRSFGHYRTLVGGKEETGRLVLAHQVYAAYRRLDTFQLKKMIDRASKYSPAIVEAAAAYGLDVDLLKGLAAAESSYYPRKSIDGGHGLFQITKVPKSALKEVNTHFNNKNQVMSNYRYNAFLAAATFKQYFNEMSNDLYLGLLAYNIGPANGGRRFIMQQYGTTDFITIQPYLKQRPRDYPIRVLSYALAFRIKRQKGKLLAYEEGKNAVKIQALGIPGH